MTWKDYPEPVKMGSGCKVGWMYYSNLDDAEECSRLARLEAGRKASDGYDFGYQVPGEITKQDNLFKVVIP